ncbi:MULTISPECIES: TM1266 family iron-only hydrogenase system putative regulator [Aminiphilus]|jgi:putative iron-only hydrogenase system regulator|uniref:TM1266 family iron-only hydrogenase system putative regulator n=1 Tax=Aminiphilus TaxID=290731 RepID=UPI0004785891|nr:MULTISPECIES: TM1266 family iron-only hydrogenase system putative regulator [Aminiphilus]
MEKRLAVIVILVTKKDNIRQLNLILSDYAHLILGRMGLPMRERSLSIISLIVEGTTDELGALAGKIGRLGGISVKSVLTKTKEADHGGSPEEILS